MTRQASKILEDVSSADAEKELRKAEEALQKAKERHADALVMVLRQNPSPAPEVGEQTPGD